MFFFFFFSKFSKPGQLQEIQTILERQQQNKQVDMNNIYFHLYS